MKHTQLFHFVALLFLSSVFFCGCHHNPQGRIEVSGTVTLDGIPLQISFEPAGSQTLKIKSGAQIVNGKYKLPVQTSLVPGEYSVRIVSDKLTGKMIETSMGPAPERLDVVPPEFGSLSTQKITVGETGKQIFDFDMKSK